MTGRVLALIALFVSLALPAAARADVNPVASGSSSGTTSTSFSLTVPAGNDRYLAVGVSTTNAVTVTAVTFGPQVLTQQQAATEDGVRSETWGLIAPNVGTATVTVTVSGNAPLIAGATSFTGVEQAAPIILGSTGSENGGSNSASFVTNGTVTKDGMFGTITLTPVSTTTEIFNQGSTDLVSADTRWSLAQGAIRGAGSTRSGNTGANMALNAGITWRWANPSGGLKPFALSWIALKATTGTTAPVVSLPTSSNVTANSATLGGTMSSTGGATISQRGVVYCTCATPVIGGSGVSEEDAGASNTAGPFAVSADGLAGGTTYTYRAFATNGAGTSYTASAQFTTVTPNRQPTANAGGPYVITEGGSLNLNGSGTDPDGDSLTYSWDVNNDSTYGDATGANPSLSTAQLDALGLDDGPRAGSVTVRVSDGTLTTTSAATPLTVNNAVPDALVTNSGPVNEGSTATVSFTNVTDPSAGDTAAGFRYAYDFNNDGTFEVGSTTYSGSSTSDTATVPASFLADGPATRTVRMVVYDRGAGPGHQYTTDITVKNVAPTGTLADRTVNEGQTATFGLTGVADPGDLATVRYVYDFDDDATDNTAATTYANASTASTANAPASATDDGPHSRTVRVRVIDEDGDSSVYTATLTVRNVNPTGTLADVTVAEGTTATVGLKNVADPGDLATVRYAYDFDDNATDNTNVSYANASTAATADLPAGLTADGPGTHIFRVRAIDKDDGFTIYTATVTVTNVAPTGTLADVTVDEGATATVGMTGVSDAGGDPVRYAYDLDNDGTYEIGSTTYANASTSATADLPAALTDDGPVTRDVRVAVVDEDGATTVRTATVTVRGVAPTGTLNTPANVDEGSVANVSFSGVTDPSPKDGAAGMKYAYDFDGDGTYDVGTLDYATASPLAAIDVPATLTADGDKDVTVKAVVIDKDGDRSPVYTKTIKVDNVDPTATLADVTTAEGTPATFTFTNADDVSADDKAAGFTYEWDVDGDGTFDPGTASIVVPTTDGPSTRTITGAIIDRDGRREYTAKLTIDNAAPTATITGPDAVAADGETTLTIRTADAGDDDLTAVLDWGDGTTDPITGDGEKTVTHTYTTPGAKTITLVATDSDGLKSAVATHELTVASLPESPGPEATPVPTATPAPTQTPASPLPLPGAKQAINSLRVAPRCLRSDDLRARISRTQTMKVRFSLGITAPVKFRLQRLSGKGGASKCPPTRGRPHPDGKRVPGVYSPFTNKSITVRKGANTVTVATTGRGGKRLKPGTYLLTITSAGVTARTKLWVLAN